MVEWLSLIRFAKMLRNSLLRTVLHENTAAEKEDTHKIHLDFLESSSLLG